MSYLKKGLSLFLAASLAAVTLAGCGAGAGSEGNGSGASDQTGTGDAPAAEADAESTGGGEAASGDVPVYTIATVRWTDAWPTDYLESGIMKELEEKHGINIEWQVYYSGDWSEQKSLLLASGDLPDAFFGSCGITDSDISQNKAYFVELTDLIDQNMPNLKAVFEKEPELLARAKDRNGEIYSLVKKLPLRPQVCGDIMYINQDWLDNLGLEAPKTLDELTEVLEAFAAQDADGDGDASNEIPVTAGKNDYLVSTTLRTLLSPFGTIVSRDNNYMGLDKNGNPVFMPVQDNYIEAVKWMHDMYQKGVLDPEFFTQEDSMATAKRQAEGGSQVGLFAGWTADAQSGLN
ncbi:MAG: extracellular solute-binding protein, partial [Lachnospiraceae bacterium]|nr:extracellular solute-binding protein [Lachnospiraceae bacterium]